MAAPAAPGEESAVLHTALLEKLDGKAYALMEDMAAAARLLGRAGAGHERLEAAGRTYAGAAQPSMNATAASIRATHAVLVEMHLALQRTRDRLLLLPPLANDYAEAAALVQAAEAVDEAFQFAEQAEYAEL